MNTLPDAIPGVKPLPPQPLPVALEPLFSCIARNANNARGYCWARTETLAGWFDVSRVHMWRLLNKLVAFGRLVIEQVPGSHERRLRPVFFAPAVKRSRSKDVTKNPRTFTTETSANAEKTTNTPAEPNERTAEPLPEPDAVVVLSLEKRNISRTVAERVARMYPRERVKAAALAVDAYLKRKGGDVNRLIQAAARDGWTPNADTDAARGQTATQERARKIQYVRAPAGFGTGNGGGGD